MLIKKGSNLLSHQLDVIRQWIEREQGGDQVARLDIRPLDMGNDRR